MNELSNHNTSANRTLLISLSSAGLFISLVTIYLCLHLCTKRRELYHMTIFRIILSIQVFSFLNSLFNLLGVFISPHTSSQCQGYVFVSTILQVSPLYLSVFTILYFQAILIHDIPLRRKWPRIALSLGTILFSLVPSMFTLIIPPRTAGMQTYCEYKDPPSTRLFVFKWLVMYIWITIAIVIGIYSMARMVIVIVKRSREACRHMSRPPSATESAEGVSTLAKENRRRRRRSSNLIIAKALSSVIWFPITPIICLGFNTVYSIVVYKKQHEDEAGFIVDKVLQFLAVPLMAMTFYLSPPVRRAFKQYLSDRKEGKRVRRLTKASRARSSTPSPSTGRGTNVHTDDDEMPAHYTMRHRESSPRSTLYSDEDELYARL
ncbi:hypothetical protein LPJ60_001289 [Coemansia sp. RSA 2675]|nr:hypothetical protein LPJ60_001289 [Coemansia sp. RSA 2675]